MVCVIVWWFWIRIWGACRGGACTRGGGLSPAYPVYWWHHLWCFLRHSWFGTFRPIGAIYLGFWFGKYYHPSMPWTSRFSNIDLLLTSHTCSAVLISPTPQLGIPPPSTLSFYLFFTILCFIWDASSSRFSSSYFSLLHASIPSALGLLLSLK